MKITDTCVSLKELLKALLMGVEDDESRKMYSGITEFYVFYNGAEAPVDASNSIIAEFGGDPLRTIDPTGKEYAHVEVKRRRHVEVFGVASVGGDEGAAVFTLMGNQNRHMLVPKGYRWCIDSFAHRCPGIHIWMLVAVPLVFMVRKPGAVISIDPVPRNTPCPFITSNPKFLWRLIKEHYSAFAPELLKKGLTHQDHPLLPTSLSMQEIEQLPDEELLEEAVNQELWEVV